MTVDKFNSLVFPEPNTGCWLYAGNFGKSGHGRGSFQKGIQLAHRFAYLIHSNVDPDKMDVLHKCDVPNCVNPEHLYLGDQRQNNIDRDTRGRQKTQRGTDHKLAKLDDEKVLEIRRYWSLGIVQQRQLARIYEISQRKILDILKNRSWKHLL